MVNMVEIENMVDAIKTSANRKPQSNTQQSGGYRKKFFKKKEENVNSVTITLKKADNKKQISKNHSLC